MRIPKRGAAGSRVDSSPRQTDSPHRAPAPVWVSHTSSPDDFSEVDDAGSTGRTASASPCAERQNGGDSDNIKDRIKSLFPKTWGSTIREWAKANQGFNATATEESSTVIKILPNGTRVSPPVSPLVERRLWDNPDGSLATSSQRSYKPLLRDNPVDNDLFHQSPQEDSLLTSIHPAEYYAEKLEVYKLKYSYLKSWPGLLRLLAGLQLLFGGMVIACVIAYIQKDSEWSNSYGLTNGLYNNGQGLSGYSYRGPMTPFVLAVAGLSWIITVILLVVGMTMYYRAILLDSAWWPLTEAFINLALFLLYMAAGIVYLNDLNRGGLCQATVGLNPIMANLCRVDGGQMAGTAFLFINMLMYLVSFLVSLKMWRHEARRREMLRHKARRREMGPFKDEHREEHNRSTPLSQTKPKKISFKEDVNGTHEYAVTQNPNTHMVADYIKKYPEIKSFEERERYKAVFNDQYHEYKDLHRDLNTTLNKFQELDAMMAQLLRNDTSHTEQQRIQRILQKYEEKKKDPAFLEQRERYIHMKAKLSHIKNRIRVFDTMENHDMKK